MRSCIQFKTEFGNVGVSEVRKNRRNKRKSLAASRRYFRVLEGLANFDMNRNYRFGLKMHFLTDVLTK